MLQSKIRAGERDSEISFIEEVTTRGASNQDKRNSWQLIGSFPTVFARRTELKGSEVVINDQLKYIQKTVFNVRYREDVTTKNRAVFRTKVYEIISVTEPNESRKTSLDIVANLIDNEFFTIGAGFTLGFTLGFMS